VDLIVDIDPGRPAMDLLGLMVDLEGRSGPPKWSRQTWPKGMQMLRRLWLCS
jgi:hypothetical protein